MSLLFLPTSLNGLQLQNRLVMAPLTRSRATGNVPNALMTEYYAQRASVGLIITEGTSPSPNGLGYPRIPGIFSAEQTSAWKLVVDAVHAKGAKLFIQFMHCGRIGHALNLPQGARLLAPSAIQAAGEMYTDSQGMQPLSVPLEMSREDIAAARLEFVQAAKNAMVAGFDGVELHAANGYLLEQFIRPNSNQRRDSYGGSIENRSRFVLEVLDAVAQGIGKDRVGIRLSPFGVFNDMPDYAQMAHDYAHLVGALNLRRPAYIHLVDHSAMGAPPVPASIRDTVRDLFKGALILSGGYDLARAEHDLEAGKCDLVAVGRPILANPDLISRWKSNAMQNTPDMATFYTPGPHGYTDYPFL